MKPLVSVIVPIYKVEQYLERCVQSIVAQTYKNLEIILVDDGSPDTCPSMCDAWKEKDPRILVIHKKNGGLSDARNAGIRIAKGEYFCFVDSDDYIFPNMIESMVAAAEGNHVKMVIMNFRTVEEDGKRVFAEEESPIGDRLMEACDVISAFYDYLGWYYIVAWNKLYHRSIFQNISFPKGKLHEDEYLAAQSVWEAGKVACLAEEGYYYIYNRKGSIMNTLDYRKYQFWLEALYLRFCFLKEHGEKPLADITRKVYFRELENLMCGEYKGAIPKQVRKQVMANYQKMDGKSRNEKIYWLLFKINPIMEYRLIHGLRNRRSK